VPVDDLQELEPHEAAQEATNRLMGVIAELEESL
jgi:hypothetical protein